MTAATPLLNGGPAPANSFVVWDRRIVYVSVTKAACTSLRWMVADLAGEDLERFRGSLGAQQSRLMTIHGSREKWQRTPRLSDLSEARLSEISRDNGWFVFAVVRDPWSRLWSAWQSKFLVRHWSHDGLRSEPWYPSEPTSQGQIVEDFRAFVEAGPWVSNPLLTRDVHFLPQVHSLHPREVNYSRVYDLGSLDELFDDLRAHLAGLGDVPELYVPRANETPLPLIPAVLENGVAGLVEQLYADDFAELGDRWSLDQVRGPGRSWTADAIRHAAQHVVANERIGDLSREAQGLRRRWRRTTRRNRELSREVEALRLARGRKGRVGG